jgi:predicted ATPase
MKSTSQSDFSTNDGTDLISGIIGVSAIGYKSLYDECSIELSLLTILAGSNSAGKSRIIQPLLLMKQTLEAPYDPGTLLLHGAEIKFTLAQQLLSRIPNRKTKEQFSVKVVICGR